MKIKINIDKYIEWRFADVEDDSQQEFLLDIFIDGWKGISEEYEYLSDFYDIHECIPKWLVTEGFDNAWEHINYKYKEPNELGTNYDGCHDVLIEWVE